MIAAASTLLITLGIILLLFCCGLQWNKAALTEASLPEEPDEELFIEVEESEDIAADDADIPSETQQQAEPQPLGLPQEAEQEVKQQITPSENTKPTRSNENVITSAKPQPVKAEKPKPEKRQESNIASQMGSQFGSVKPGAQNGRHGSAGIGGNGVKVQSSGVKGRGFRGCTTGKVSSSRALNVRVTVKVSVNAAGRVVNASIQSSGGASPDLQSRCLKWAKTARWDAKPGAADAPGSLTFHIVVKG